jgi:hypothetical protein
MRKLFAVALVVLVAIAMMAPSADAWVRGQWHGGGHGHGGRVFVGFGFYGPGWWGGYPYPYYGYGYPYYAYPPPMVYTAPPAQYSAPAPAMSEPAQPAAVQREVIYPHGKYVLEGDGVTTAYKWVWFSNTPGETR